MGDNKSRWFILGILCLFFVIIFAFYINFFINQAHHFSVDFFDVGQGDATLIQFENGEKMLVDCSINEQILSKLGEALPFFDRTIDYLLITHPDNDHYGGCPAVLKRYNVKHIITNGVQKIGDPLWDAFEKYYQSENADYKIINGQDQLKVGDNHFIFLSPDDDLQMDKNKMDGNNSSIVFLLENNIGRFLFTGDMEIPLEAALLKKYCDVGSCSFLRADYLKVGHHGSDSSSSDAFLSAVMPKYAVISVGPNKFGHPSLRILRKLDRIGAKIWRTDLKDDIIVK